MSDDKREAQECEWYVRGSDGEWVKRGTLHIKWGLTREMALRIVNMIFPEPATEAVKTE